MITVYTKPGCSRCDLTKRHLTSLDADFEMVNVGPGMLTQLAQEGFTSLPVVKLGEVAFCGFQPDKLEELVRIDSKNKDD